MCVYERHTHTHTHTLIHTHTYTYTYTLFSHLFSMPRSVQDWFLSDHYLPYALGGGYVISSNVLRFLVANHRILTKYKSEVHTHTHTHTRARARARATLLPSHPCCLNVFACMCNVIDVPLF